MDRLPKIKKIDDAFELVKENLIKGHFESVNKLLNKLYFKSIKINYKEGKIKFYEYSLTLYIYISEFYKAIPLIQKLIKEYEKDNNLIRLFRVYIKFGVILSRVKDFESSDIYFKKALEINSKIKPINPNNNLSVHIEVAINFTSRKMHNDALKQVDLGLKIAKKYNNFEVRTFYLLLIKMSNLTSLFNLKEAKETLLEIEGMKILDNKLYQVNFDKVKIDLLLKEPIENNKKILNLVHSTLKTSIELSNNEFVLELIEVLKNYHFKNNEKDLAYKYSDQLNELYKKEKEKPVSILNLNNPERIKYEENEEEFEIYYKSELEVAARYQQKIYLNRNLLLNLNIEKLYIPSKTLSGDYVGTFNLDGNSNLLILGDVVGKGITASYISFMLDGIIKTIIKSTGTFCLNKNISDINEILSDSLNNQGFVSLWAGIIDTDNETLESVNAGHLPTHVIKKEGNIIKLVKGCTILGMFEELPFFESEKIEFLKGDSLVVISDGVTESIDKNDVYFEENYNDLIKKYALEKSFNFVSQLKIELNNFQDKQQEQDDVSCLFVEYKNTIKKG